MSGADTRPTMNDRRANWADSTLQHFMRLTGCDGADALSDLLCDLKHWCDQRGEDFELELARGDRHYRHEVAYPEEDL